MAEFSIQLKTLLQTDFDPQLNEYPIFDESYREVLNQKILDHYYFYEIGLETPDMFNHYLKTRMNEIMPYYNELYRVQALIVNPYHNFDLEEKSSREIDGQAENETTGKTTDSSSQNTNTTNKKGKQTTTGAQSDTPQSNLTPYNVDTGGYASLVNKSETESEDDQTTTNNSASSAMNQENKLKGTNKTMDDYVRTMKGIQGGSQAEILAKYKQAYTNIDLEIITELRDLFMIVY